VVVHWSKRNPAGLVKRNQYPHVSPSMTKVFFKVKLAHHGMKVLSTEAKRQPNRTKKLSKAQIKLAGDMRRHCLNTGLARVYGHKPLEITAWLKPWFKLTLKSHWRYDARATLTDDRLTAACKPLRKATSMCRVEWPMKHVLTMNAKMSGMVPKK